jgi:hypothetical protein
MLLSYFLITLILVLLLWQSQSESFEAEIDLVLEPPYRYTAPTLYPTTGAVDMLTMKKFLLINGYRFQNALTPPEPSNLRVDLRGHCGPRYAYPASYIQRTGNFKERAFIEGFDATSQATLAQMDVRGGQDLQLVGDPGDTIEPSYEKMNPFGKWVEASVPDRRAEVNYPYQAFSWGDMINRFYENGNPDAMDIVL